MKRELTLMLLIVLVLPPILGANATTNQTSNQTQVNETTWYEDYVNKATSVDLVTLVAVLIGLILVYVLGKFAFKLIKWAIIILALIIVLKVIL